MMPTAQIQATSDPQVRGRSTGSAPVPDHWRGPLPDPSVERTLAVHQPNDEDHRYVRVPTSLLHGGFQDLGILVWVQLGLWFNRREGVTNYRELAENLAVDTGSRSAITVKISGALQPLLGTWIQRRRHSHNQYAYRAVTPNPRERYAIIRQDDLGLLTATRQAERRVKPADIADFARWQLECERRGWTAETAGVIAGRWNVTPTTVRTSRKRLETLGLLKTVRREGPGRLNEIVWLAEIYDPDSELIDTMSSWRITSRSPFRSRVAVARKTVVGARSGPPGPEGDLHQDPLTLSDLRHRRAVQRHQAIAVLTSPSRSVRRPADRWQTHEVYLIHFPVEGCFKVGLSRSGTARIEDFVRHGGIVVDRVSVSSRSLAELIEADILQSVEDWHRLGDRLRAGGGYTEMWSDDGPTVDLQDAARQAAEFVERVKAELAVEGHS